MRLVLAEACHRAGGRRPILLEVGADWCSDCRRLQELEAEEPLKTALLRFEHVALNLGEDRQEWLRDAFRIKAIARWLVFIAPSCETPVETWKPIASRVVEPDSRKRSVGAEQLTQWLEHATAADPTTEGVSQP